MHTTVGKLGAVACVAALVGCAGDSQWTGTITDSAGVAIVANTGDGLWSDADRWTLEEELRIGTVDGDPEYQFGQVGSIAADSRNHVYVSDVQAQDIRVFDEGGTYVRTIGGPGSGPGELGLGAALVLIGRGDTLLVPDLQNQRINRYLPDGTSLGSTPVELQRGLPTQFRVTPSRTIVMQLRPFALPNMAAPDSMDAIVVLEPSGEVGDTIMRFPSGGTLNLGGASPEITIFAPEPLWDVTADLGVVYAVNNAYQISRYARNGALERVVRMAHVPTPVSEQDRRAILQYFERQWRDAGLPATTIAQARSMIKFGDLIPAFSALMIGPDNTIWVQHQRSLADLTDEELEQFNIMEELGAPNWDVFDADGRYLGVVTMPPMFQPRHVVGNKLYGVWRDEYDVQYVKRFAIQGAPADR